MEDPKGLTTEQVQMIKEHLQKVFTPKKPGPKEGWAGYRKPPQPSTKRPEFPKPYPVDDDYWRKTWTKSQYHYDWGGQNVEPVGSC